VRHFYPPPNPITYLLKAYLILSSHHFLGLPNGGFIDVSPSEVCTYSLFSPFYPHAQSIIMLLVLSDLYTSRSSLLCNFLNYSLSSSVLSQNIFLCALVSNARNVCPSLRVSGTFHTNKIQLAKLFCLCLCSAFWEVEGMMAVFELNYKRMSIINLIFTTLEVLATGVCYLSFRTDWLKRQSYLSKTLFLQTPIISLYIMHWNNFYIYKDKLKPSH
jgi:hypothetical protein